MNQYDYELNGWLKKKARKMAWRSLPAWQKALIIGTAAAAVDSVFFDGKIILRRTGRITGKAKK